MDLKEDPTEGWWKHEKGIFVLDFGNRDTVSDLLSGKLVWRHP